MWTALSSLRDESNKGVLKSPRFWLTIAMQFLWNVEPEWKRHQMGLHIESCQGGDHQIYSVMLADDSWILSHSNKHLERMMKDFIEEAER